MNKIALVTGASKGIGAAIAKSLAKENYTVIINYNNSEKTAFDLATEINSGGGNALALKADVSNKSQVEQMFEYILKAFGRIDLLVNNAGISKQNLFTDISEDELKKITEVNYYGTFYCSQFAAKNMIQNQTGKIINISSIWGVCGASMESHYAASKAAVIALTKSLAKELAPSNITVNCIAPGATQTDMMKMLGDEITELVKEETPLGRLATPNEIAACVKFLASDDADFITGETININGGSLI